MALFVRYIACHGGPIPRPSRRSDLTHFDFFLSGWKKIVVQVKWLY